MTELTYIFERKEYKKRRKEMKNLKKNLILFSKVKNYIILHRETLCQSIICIYLVIAYLFLYFTSKIFSFLKKFFFVYKIERFDWSNQGCDMSRVRQNYIPYNDYW